MAFPRGLDPAAISLIAFALAAVPLASGADGPAEEPQPLVATGLIMMGSRPEGGELRLRARQARFSPETDRAELRDVLATVTYDDGRERVELTCDRAELDVETYNFTAEGDVRGVTGDGDRYSAPWVEYDHDKGLLFSDASVVMVDDTGRFRGDGFRLHVDEERFELLGNVSVVQSP